MPQADFRYSPDIQIDAEKLLSDVELLILRHDQGAGACKGRAYRADLAHHSHALLSVMVLNKPHRDNAFMNALLQDLTALLDDYLPSGTERAVSLSFSSGFYSTGKV